MSGEEVAEEVDPTECLTCGWVNYEHDPACPEAPSESGGES